MSVRVRRSRLGETDSKLVVKLLEREVLVAQLDTVSVMLGFGPRPPLAGSCALATEIWSRVGGLCAGRRRRGYVSRCHRRATGRGTACAPELCPTLPGARGSTLPARQAYAAQSPNFVSVTQRQWPCAMAAHPESMQGEKERKPLFARPLAILLFCPTIEPVASSSIFCCLSGAAL